MEVHKVSALLVKCNAQSMIICPLCLLFSIRGTWFSWCEEDYVWNVTFLL